MRLLADANIEAAIVHWLQNERGRKRGYGDRGK